MGIAADFLCSNPYAEGSFKLNDYNSVFQAEIVVITKGEKWASALINVKISPSE